MNKTKRDKPLFPETCGPATGPGAYDPDKAATVTKPRTKSALINRSKRPQHFEKKEDNQPAPGEYNSTKPFGTGV
jgi:hypothetical protein